MRKDGSAARLAQRMRFRSINRSKAVPVSSSLTSSSAASARANCNAWTWRSCYGTPRVRQSDRAAPSHPLARSLFDRDVSLDDLHVTAKEHVLQFFREDVEEFLRREEIPLFRDVKLSGKSGLDHHFDIGLPSDSRHPERVLKAINKLNHDTAATFAFSGCPGKDRGPCHRIPGRGGRVCGPGRATTH